MKAKRIKWRKDFPWIGYSEVWFGFISEQRVARIAKTAEGDYYCEVAGIEFISKAEKIVGEFLQRFEEEKKKFQLEG